MSSYFLKHYIKEINEEYLNNIKKYIDKNEIIPTSCFFYDYSSKIKSAINFASSLEKEYEKWFNETIDSYLRNRNYFQFNFTKEQNDKLKSLYLLNKTKAKEKLLKELSYQNKTYENKTKEKENNKTKESKLSENENKQKSLKDKENFEKNWSKLINSIEINYKDFIAELLELAELYYF